uniref:Acyltransferase family protein n=1 Tax=Durinskia baltica TaxID=59809 RepID=W5VG01_9DINO|nr:acyltransferase family protein [Durinskia baltica]
MAAEGDVKPKAPSKPRIDAIDGCRFALVLPIVIAHFARFSTDNKRLLKIMTQENVLVGGFFVISGYVAGYTATMLGEKKADMKKLAKPELFFWQKVMSYYPLHFVIASLFTPMWIWVERMYNTPWHMTAFRGFLSFSMLQAWFPKEGEIWNQPTWFLSALTFSNLTMPAVLPRVAALGKGGLKKLFFALTAVSVLQKFSYSETARFHAHNITSKQQYPLIWNLTRFHPFWALIEMTMGIAAVREVMLDTPEDKKKSQVNPAVWFAAAYGTLLLRLSNALDFNDGIIRSTLFVPLYTKFLTSVHRDCISENPSAITKFFGSKTMTTLGSLAFPMFILHGPIGQVLYKKAIAVKLWGKPMPNSFFPMYLLICLLCSHFVNEHFVKSKKVAQVAGKVAQWLASNTEGLLRDQEC